MRGSPHTLSHPPPKETGFEVCGVSLESTAPDSTGFGLANTDAGRARYAMFCKCRRNVVTGKERINEFELTAFRPIRDY